MARRDSNLRDNCAIPQHVSNSQRQNLANSGASQPLRRDQRAVARFKFSNNAKKLSLLGSRVCTSSSHKFSMNG
jgi:hypothetical protein